MSRMPYRLPTTLTMTISAAAAACLNEHAMTAQDCDGAEHLLAGGSRCRRRRQLQSDSIRVHRHALHRRLLQHGPSRLLKLLPSLHTGSVHMKIRLRGPLCGVSSKFSGF